MFHADYPYRSSGSQGMVRHFEQMGRRFLDDHLNRPESFIVEIGSNDGVMLRTVAEAGVRHLGVDPSSGVGESAREQGVRVLTDFFEEQTAARILADEGAADVIYSANTLCHIPTLDSVLGGVTRLLRDDGIFVFEDPYIGDILKRRSFDQIYDEHFYFFSATSVQQMARTYGFELIDVERLPVHGGEVRYTLAKSGRRPVSAAVVSLVAEEAAAGVNEQATYDEFAVEVERIRVDLLDILRRLDDAGERVVGYGATAKSATVNNFCGITDELVAVVYDTTPEKQGRMTPGTHIPIRPMEEFAGDSATHTLLYAWNHRDEIVGKESSYVQRGGRWITYVPTVRVG